MALSLRQFLGLPQSPAPRAGSKAKQYLKHCEYWRRFRADEFLDVLLEDALRWRATDIHVVPENHRVNIRLRVDGALRDFLSLQPHHAKSLVGRMKVVGEMDFLNFYSPQDGAGRIEIGGQPVAFRISTIPVQVNGAPQERAIVRLFNQREFDLSTLGFDAGILECWRRLLDEPQGLLVLTGPANSGKTTTIYASLLEIQRRFRGERNIATVEDPVEFPVPGLSQSQVNLADEFGFPEALRAMLRQDPQVIMIGEIRDPDTARIAIEASLTGHLVLTTVHSKQVTGVFPRLDSLSIDAVRAASATLAVLNQRLLRLNCPHCLQPYTPSESCLRYVPSEVAGAAQFLRGCGCDACGGTGFMGRSTVSELLVVQSDLRSAVCSGVPSQELYDRAIAGGMPTLWQNALQVVLRGSAPLEETIRAVGTE